MENEELWRADVIIKKLNMGIATWYRWVKEGRAPKARIKGHGYSAWASSDIYALMQGKTDWGTKV